jgi:hypothetical protein
MIIDKRAKAQGGEIHWGDETGWVNRDVRGRSYAPAGKTPVAMAVDGTRHKLSMIATVTNQGTARRMMIDEALDGEKLIELFYLLSCSPQLNPEDWLNADLKQERGTKVAVRTKAKLREAKYEHMMIWKQNTERVMSYFQDH